ncbi:hypothetical protein TM7_0676 [candidate division TM7 genomosp. GTL1]|nr:hypothetical protein TM7_0617 [candidate division TM7 genomosp. GTL1]EDK72843.1 hypothetical protein TM7_0674 [candidate division TM7 genomosp. GTL1]EDK72847.1 hypothetical protein TM7_0675 [candidate division TM7 genomosp. GTL1]EDK72851.1 hypothetical protein TM7_0676 [candidate division TM7 genomosp. GTL1]
MAARLDRQIVGLDHERLQIFDLVCSDQFVRMVHAVVIDKDHKCYIHSIPCKTVIYILSSTTNHSWPNTEWCLEKMEGNGYHKMGPQDAGKDFLAFKPYSDDIPGESKFTHMYVLRLKANKWYAGLTSDLEDTIKNHFEGEDDIWTKTYPPRSVDTVMTFHTAMPAHKAIVILNKKLKELYDEYGYDNVRGLQYPS